MQWPHRNEIFEPFFYRGNFVIQNTWRVNYLVSFCSRQKMLRLFSWNFSSDRGLTQRQVEMLENEWGDIRVACKCLSWQEKQDFQTSSICLSISLFSSLIDLDPVFREDKSTPYSPADLMGVQLSVCVRLKAIFFELVGLDSCCRTLGIALKNK